MYVFDAGAWKNCGSVSPDLSNYVTVTDLNNGLSTKADTSAVDQLKTDLTNKVATLQTQVDNSAVGTNLIVAKTIQNNITLNDSGATFIFAGSFTTDYIPVVANQKYAITVYGTANASYSRIAYYDSSKNFISREYDDTISTSSPEVIVIPSKASYIRFSPNTPDKSGKYEDNYKIEKGSVATDWCPNPSEILTKADDSKVAHLSGANNFDTTPTVKNNPLLLASSLPSDLARLGQDQEFTGKNTFDVAPIDKTTGNPYITKDGVPAVPSTLADTTKLSNFTAGLQKGGKDVATTADVTTAISTATANMVDSTKATNFTAGLQSGGVNVATAADLKSIEASAWRQIALPDQQASKNLSLLYQVDEVNKQLKINLRGTFGSAMSDWAAGLVIADFGSIITSITSADIYVTLIKLLADDQNALFTGWETDGMTYKTIVPTIEFNGSKVLVRCSDAAISDGYGKIFLPTGENFAMVNNTIHYDKLV